MFLTKCIYKVGDDEGYYLFLIEQKLNTAEELSDWILLEGHYGHVYHLTEDGSFEAIMDMSVFWFHQRGFYLNYQRAIELPEDLNLGKEHHDVLATEFEKTHPSLVRGSLDKETIVRYQKARDYQERTGRSEKRNKKTKKVSVSGFKVNVVRCERNSAKFDKNVYPLK